MKTEQYILFQDQFIDQLLTPLTLSFHERGFQFGDGVYEVIRIYQGKLYMLEEHLERLFRSCREMKLAIDYTEETFAAKLQELVDKNQFQEDGIIYLSITRGFSYRNHAFPAPGTVANIIAYINALPRAMEQFLNGVTVSLEKDIRWLRCDIKSLNLLGNVLIRQEVVEKGCYEAILYREEKYSFLTEGTSSNMFFVKQGKVYTHPTDNYILNGITRRKIKQLCDKLSIPFMEEKIHPDRLAEFDEMFLASTGSEVTPIVKILTSGEPLVREIGPVTVKIRQAFHEDILSVIS